MPLFSELDLEFDSEGSGDDTFLLLNAQQTSNCSSRDRVLTEQLSQNSYNMAKLRTSTTGQRSKKPGSSGPTKEEKQARMDALAEKNAAKRARDSLEDGAQFESKEQEMRALQARLKQLQENPPDEGVGSGRTSPVQVATSRFSSFGQRQRMYSYPDTAENREIQALHAQNSAPPGGFSWPTGNPWSGDPNMLPGATEQLFTVQPQAGGVVKMTVNLEVDNKVKTLAQEIIWPKCKFLSNENQILEVCKIVMEALPEVKRALATGKREGLFGDMWAECHHHHQQCPDHFHV